MRARRFPWVLLAYVDTLAGVVNILTLFLFILFMAPHMKAAETAKQNGIVAGRMCAELHWPDDLDVDLDLWGRGPDNVVIGYSSRSGPMMDLLRDDIGFKDNPTHENFEIMCSRELAKGDWTFNAHYYAPHQSPDPKDIPVRLIISFPSSSKTAPPPIVRDAVIHQQGDEITILDFDLDGDGHVVTPSINSIYQPLRSVKGSVNGQ